MQLAETKATNKISFPERIFNVKSLFSFRSAKKSRTLDSSARWSDQIRKFFCLWIAEKVHHIFIHRWHHLLHGFLWCCWRYRSKVWPRCQKGWGKGTWHLHSGVAWSAAYRSPTRDEPAALSPTDVLLGERSGESQGFTKPSFCNNCTFFEEAASFCYPFPGRVDDWFYL